VTLRKITGNAVALQEGSQVAVTEADPVIGVQYHCWRQQRINQVTGWNRDLRGRYVRNRITRHVIYLTEFFSAKSSLWSRPVLTKVLRTGVDAAVPAIIDPAQVLVSQTRGRRTMHWLFSPAAQEDAMQIWVDADACPLVTREVLYRAANRCHVELALVDDQALTVPPSPYIRCLQVEKGFDVADRDIARRAVPGDLVITSDIPLAAEVVEKGALALSPRGEL